MAYTVAIIVCVYVIMDGPWTLVIELPESGGIHEVEIPFPKVYKDNCDIVNTHSCSVVTHTS